MSNLKIYKASAGSGKTYTLALEYIKELLVNRMSDAHRHILAVTFTKDATGEMKDRILAELYGLASGCKDSNDFLHSIRKDFEKAGKPMKEETIREKSRIALKEILHDYSRLYITTIDSFFQKVLRNLARELGKGSGFNLEMNSSKILSEAVKSMIENADRNPQLLDWLTTYMEEKLEEGGSWYIDREILNFSKCIFDESFQEHEMELKKQLDDNPGIFEQLWTQHTRIQKECREFFRKAYLETDQAIKEHHLDLSDFSRNGTVITFLRKLSDGDFAGAKTGKTIEDCCMDAAKWPASKSKRKEDVIRLATLNFMPVLNRSLDVLRKYNTSRMVTQNLHQLGLIWDISNEISDQNAEKNRFMLADTALFLNRMIDESDAPFIYEKIGAEIRHVMIDEFQDTSRLQWKNFKALLSNIIASNSFSLIVGDVKQSIYRWRNGDWSILNGIEQELGAKSKTLSSNYRSQQAIVAFNNSFFTHAAGLLNEKFISIFGDFSFSPFLSAYDPADVVQQTVKPGQGYVSVDFIPDKTEDAKYNDLVLERLLEQIRRLCDRGIPPGEICILARTNKHIITIAEYLAAQKNDNKELAGRYYLNIVSSEAFQLNSSPAVRIIIEALRSLAYPENPVPKAQLQIFLDKLVKKSSDRLNTILEEKNQYVNGLDDPDKLMRMPLLELAGHLFRTLHLEQLEGQSSYMFTFYDAVSNYLNDLPAGIHAFLKYWDEELQFKSVPAGTAVAGIRAMTIHKSKGLQFHTVLLPFCDWDLYPEKSPIVWCSPKEGLYELELLPVRYTSKMADTVFLDEYEKETGQSWMDNLNLLYVAFTRAENNLLILGKHKKKLESTDDIRTVSDLLQLSAGSLSDSFDEENPCIEKGCMDNNTGKEKHLSDNLLKVQPQSLGVTFVSETLNPDKSIFRQSNKSREFINPEAAARNEYIAFGNIMHALFSKIETPGDIPQAVDQLSFDGLILPGEKASYISNLTQAVAQAGVEDWFSGRHKVYNECAVIINDNGEITTKRPDRVLLSDNETIIIDYKFGESKSSHQKQMKQYIDLMRQMNYTNIKGYIWYVTEARIIPVA